MAIEVKHGVGAGPIAGAAFGGGQGAARQRAMLGGAAAATRLEAQSNALEAQAQQSALAHQRGLEDMQARFGLQQQAAQSAFERSELSYTNRQRAELERMAEAEAEALSSDDFTDEEKAEVRRRFAAKRGGIEPVERPKKLTPAERFEQNTFTDPRTGRVYALDDKGMPGRAIYEPPERQPTVQDHIAAAKAAHDVAQQRLTDRSNLDANGEFKLSYAELYKEQIKAIYAHINQQPKPRPAGTPGAPGGAAAAGGPRLAPGPGALGAPAAPAGAPGVPGAPAPPGPAPAEEVLRLARLGGMAPGQGNGQWVERYMHPQTREVFEVPYTRDGGVTAFPQRAAGAISLGREWRPAGESQLDRLVGGYPGSKLGGQLPNSENYAQAAAMPGPAGVEAQSGAPAGYEPSRASAAQPPLEPAFQRLQDGMLQSVQPPQYQPPGYLTPMDPGYYPEQPGSGATPMDAAYYQRQAGDPFAQPVVPPQVAKQPGGIESWSRQMTDERLVFQVESLERQLRQNPNPETESQLNAMRGALVARRARLAKGLHGKKSQGKAKTAQRLDVLQRVLQGTTSDELRRWMSGGS